MIYYNEVKKGLFLLFKDDRLIEYSSDFIKGYNRTLNKEFDADFQTLDILDESITFVYPFMPAIPAYPIKTIDGTIHYPDKYLHSQDTNANNLIRMLIALGYDAYTKRVSHDIDVTDAYIRVPILKVSSSASLFVSFPHNGYNMARYTAHLLKEDSLSFHHVSYNPECSDISVHIENGILMLDIPVYKTECVVTCDIVNALRLEELKYVSTFRFKHRIISSLVCFFEGEGFSKIKGLKSNLRKLRGEMRMHRSSDEHASSLLVSLLNLLIRKNISLNNLKHYGQ